MDKDESWAVIDDVRVTVADLLEGLDDDGWASPSWCDGWTVRDVGAHLSMAATMGTLETIRWVVAARGSFDRMIDLATRDRGKRPTTTIVAELRGTVGSRRLAPTTTWRDPLIDALVHSQDIARPLGRDLPLPPEAAREAVEWVWQRRAPFHPERALAGVRLVATDTGWTRGEGDDEVRGETGELLLLSTGRPMSALGLDGPGVATLDARGPR
ncbi:maleylpyruvate isomerase family mycothiol-dependent enzyme [Terracoccus luteus]|uniref:Uncharacterized protein (TIGR03083 family) n=1 Tax=Terracoccus luteus TaxID=53356 RepID=A0A839PUM3_9MICO|nr:maleylpyruvate isomerase family mycothiol-dependent enzyme [Terracoccus luteus]MBB2986454.1 uncharacterized protein (TIGR03083 family) [Terracoccus luteus]MCP2171957.1 uncharacterized protein (TIGR03083 family) [Terracoccus luteus]